MAEKDQDQTENKKPGKSGKMMLIIIAVVAVGAGLATPILVNKVFATTPESEEDKADKGKKSESSIPEPGEKTTLLDFEEIVVNLNEERFNRFLKVNFAIQIAESQKAEIETLLADRRALLKSWLMGHLQDKSLEDVSGKLEYNRLRREINDQFNKLLFDDGIERIQDVLFKEYNVQ